MKHISLLVISMLVILPSMAQTKFTISGYVKDATDGESMLGANVYVKEIQKGSSSNTFGFYSITLPEGEYTFEFSYLGYDKLSRKITLDANIDLDVELNPAYFKQEEVVITGERTDENVDNTKMGTVDIPIKNIKALPALLGEVDVLRVMQLLPGVISSGEANSGLYVRGGGPDQNLILIDDAVVYNSGHLFGFYSVFNSDAIKDVELIKGGMPANYGGRLSSVLLVNMREGNQKEYDVTGGIGLISSRLTVEGPFKKDVASFMVSGRRTYIDVLTKPILKNINDGEFANNAYYFYDLNAKVNWKISKRDRIYASGYFGRDVFSFADDDFKVDVPWGNATGTLRWNHLFSDKVFMNTMLIYNDYNFGFSSQFQDIDFRISSGIRNFGGKMDLDYYHSVDHKFKFGLLYNYNIFTPYTTSGTVGDINLETTNADDKLAHEYAIYALDEFNIGSRIKLNLGVRASLFNPIGPYKKIVFDEQTGRAIDTISYKKGESVTTYGGIEPRLSARFKINEVSSIKTGLTINNQYIHLVTSSTTTLPTDLWFPSSGKVKPQRGYQVSAGYFHNFKENRYETSLEFFYKKMNNQLEYGEGQIAELGEDIEDSFVPGDGQAYGLELLLKKAKGDLNGWIGYTLSRSIRQFPDLNNGEVFPAKYDRRHDISVVASYKLGEKITLSGTFVYGTGMAFTPAVGVYFIEGKLQYIYGERNSYRLPTYHRMDLGSTFVLKDAKRYSDLTVSVYNVYNRQNPYFIYPVVEGDLGEEGYYETKAKQVSLFGVLPSVTWNFKF